MCGIVGMAGKIDHQMKQTFKDMLTVCQIRGKDSTGAIRVDQSDKFHYVKRACLPNELLDLKTYDKEIDTGTAKALIGHCRAKTFGQINSKNAHPFEHAHVCGVHNGTVNGCYTMEGRRDFDVDSDWLYWHISRYGVEETIPKIEHTEAWALVWWDEDQKTLNFLKNDKRPLYFTFSEDLKTIFWASETWMFGTVYRKHKLWDGGADKQVYFPLDNDTWYAYEINENGKTPQEVFKMRVPVEVKGEVRGNRGNYQKDHGNTGANRQLASNVADFRRPAGNGGEVVHPFPRPGHNRGLNDDIADLTSGKKDVKALPHHSQGHIPIVGGAKSTSSSSTDLSKSSPNSSASSTGSTNGTNTGRPKLSLPSTPSSLCQPEGSASRSKGCLVITESSPSPRISKRPLVSLRNVAGLDYITDGKSGREFVIHIFDEKTEGKCHFCTQPIGDLKEVFEIFVRPKYGHVSEDEVSFLCKSCTEPHYNS